METNDVDAILGAALVALADCPMSLSDLTATLRQLGVLAAFDGLDHEALMSELDEILLDTDDVWMSEDQVVALTSTLLDGVVFSHRLTQSELERGVLDATPDLGAIDFDAFDGLEMTSGGTLQCRYPFAGEPGPELELGLGLDENGSYVLPPGSLSTFGASDLLCLRREGSKVSLEVASEPGHGEAEVRALRAAFENQHVEGLGVEPDQMVMDALCHNPSLFHSPVPPIGELLESIGLERCGAWFGLRGEDWAPPLVRYMESEYDALCESWGFNGCCEAAFEIVRGAWSESLTSRRALEREDLRSVARGLVHGSVAPAFAEYVLRDHDYGSESLTSFAVDIAHLPGKLSAPGLYLQALEAEREGRAIVAEELLRASVRADPDYGPALAELAWYEADRGDAQMALSLLRRSDMHDDDPELDYLSSRVPTRTVSAGRNDPCPCGSRRKFKACCIDGPTLTIEQRAGWLYHKAVNFSLRPQRRNRVESLFELAAYGLSAAASEHLLPFLVDLGVFELGGLEEFAGERGALLPHDELTLARTWLGTPLVLWEIIAVDRGTTVTLRNTRSGVQTIVTERSASEMLDRGDYLLARVVVAYSQHQIVGLPLEVTLRQRESLIELLDSDPDAEDVALWLATAFAPPRITNREGEDVVLCRATLRPRSTSWKQLTRQLDEQFGAEGDAQWTEKVDVEGDSVVRCLLHREGDDLVVESNSVERFDRLLAALQDELATKLEVIDEQRLSPSEALAQRTDLSEVSESIDAPQSPAELTAELADMMQLKEKAWLDEQIPALSGLTPRQAVNDPTRREDLITLLNEFDRIEDLPSGMLSFDTLRLRKELDL